MEETLSEGHKRKYAALEEKEIKNMSVEGQCKGHCATIMTSYSFICNLQIVLNKFMLKYFWFTFYSYVMSLSHSLEDFLFVCF